MTLLGRRIRSLRKEKSLTQQELGNLINVTKVSICCYEKGTRMPTLETLLALCKIFNVDINYFIGNDNYLVAEQDEKYGSYVAKEELEFLEEIKKHPNLYNRVITNPKRFVDLIEMKMR